MVWREPIIIDSFTYVVYINIDTYLSNITAFMDLLLDYLHSDVD